MENETKKKIKELIDSVNWIIGEVEAGYYFDEALYDSGYVNTEINLVINSDGLYIKYDIKCDNLIKTELKEIAEVGKGSNLRIIFSLKDENTGLYLSYDSIDDMKVSTNYFTEAIDRYFRPLAVSKCITILNLDKGKMTHYKKDNDNLIFYNKNQEKVGELKTNLGEVLSDGISNIIFTTIQKFHGYLLFGNSKQNVLEWN